MSAEAATERSFLPVVLAIFGLPAVVGVVGFAEGYPVPQRPSAMVGVAVGAVVLAVIGALVGWLRTHRLLLAPGVAVLGVVGGTGWALLEPGVTSVTVGSAVVIEGEPVLSRFVGASPLWLVAVIGLAVLEAATRGTTSGYSPGPATTQLGHLAALAYGFFAGLLLAVLSLLPAVLLGDPVTEPSYLVYAAIGGIVGGLLVGYLRLRHRVLSPLLVLAVVAGGATMGITAGGSPRGFPMAWPVWIGLAVMLAVIEGLARGIQRRVVGR
ncbi:MAG: hypothetical protein ABEH59_13510 [Halobacteriales archaeon]